jgi:integrase
MSALTHVKATEMYKVRCTEVKVDTHRAELAQAQALCRWAIKQGHATTNPFDGIEPVGRKSAGKDQLRVDEARRFLGTALADPTPEATAVALALLTGARASEVVDRVVRDLDDGGRLLHIPAAKTRAGIRQVGVPECVRARLLALADGKARDARLFPDLDRYRLRLKVRGLCKAAGVPVVTTHGLRGVHATVAVRHVSADIVARELGQTGAAVTRRHYIAPGTEETQRAAVLESTLTETSAL